MKEELKEVPRVIPPSQQNANSSGSSVARPGQAAVMDALAAALTARRKRIANVNPFGDEEEDSSDSEDWN